MIQRLALDLEDYDDDGRGPCMFADPPPCLRKGDVFLEIEVKADDGGAESMGAWACLEHAREVAESFLKEVARVRGYE